MAFYIQAAVFGGLSALLAMLGLGSSVAIASLFLFFIPLPLIYATIRYDHFCGLLAVLLATAGLVLLFSAPVALAFLAGIALPSWLAGFLFMRVIPEGQTKSANDNTRLVWFPVGSIVAIIAVLASALIGLSVLAAPSFEAYETAMRDFSNQLLSASTTSELSVMAQGASRDDMVKMLAQFLPIMAAITWLMMILMNAWLAARICFVQQGFPRPRPDFFRFSLPRWFNYVMPAAFLLTFFQGPIGLLGSVGIVAGMLSFMLVGLSVIHMGTQGVRMRRLILCGVYFFLLVQGWALLLIALLGLVEHYAGLKRRFFNKPEAVSKK